jgi:chaperone required for assembly of F1-ATPase
MAAEAIDEVINDFGPQIINLIIDVFGENTIINEFASIAQSVLNQLIQTFAEELKVVFEVFHFSDSMILIFKCESKKLLVSIQKINKIQFAILSI